MICPIPLGQRSSRGDGILSPSLSVSLSNQSLVAQVLNMRKLLQRCDRIILKTGDAVISLMKGQPTSSQPQQTLNLMMFFS